MPLKKSFISAVAKHDGNFLIIDSDYLVELDCSEILTGFMVERTLSGGHINLFVYPLFDVAGWIHLTYSDRLPYPTGFIDTFDLRKMTPNEFAIEFLSRIQPFRDKARQLRNLENFANYLATMEGGSHPTIVFGRVQSLVLLGRQSEAMEQLQLLEKEKQEYLKDKLPHIRTLRECLDESLESAQREIKRRIRMRRIELGLDKPTLKLIER